MNDKSPRQKLSQKSGQSLKQKRAAKKDKAEIATPIPASRKPRRG
jgi:hypothetical protein